MKCSRGLPPLFVLLIVTGITLGLAPERAAAQRPGQLSASKGKRWFSKNAPKAAGGLFSQGVEARRAHRKALREAAMAERAAGSSERSDHLQASDPARPQIQELRRDGDARNQASRQKMAPRVPDASPARPPARSKRVAGTKIARKSPGRRGAGSGAIGKRRRSILTPLFGN